MLVWCGAITNGHGTRVKINRRDLILEKNLDIRNRKGLFQEIFVKKRTVDGIDTLEIGAI